MNWIKHLSIRLMTCAWLCSAVTAYALPSYSQEVLKAVQPKFTPDPQVYMGTTGGNVALIDLVGSVKVDGQCQGFTTQIPTYILKAAKPFDLLSLKVFAKDGQTTLLVKGPDGIYCRDSSNPELLGAWMSGDYQIWVGSKTGEAVSYKLSISETSQ